MIPAIELSGLTKSWPSGTAVNHLDLTVPTGCIFGFLGPNGAGKTTTIRMISRLTEPTSGSIRIFGKSVDNLTAEDRQAVGVLFSEPALHDLMTAGENASWFGRLSGLNERSINQRMARLGRWLGVDTADSKLAGDFSSGMRKKLGLLCAMMAHPKLLILDEPFESVDPAGTRRIRRLLTSYAQAGGTVFLSSHVLSQLEAVMTHLAIIHHGELVLSGEIGTIRSELQSLQQKTDLESIFLSSTDMDDEPDIEFTWEDPA
ncbi:MAG: ABC transporter ATP-binding protein [Bacteroidetes bacterium]|nr:ABC transporter ATP-binding protein [Bacteroidota bacterium]